MTVHASNLISRILGTIVIYVAIFLYEDEEGKYQNKLEEWWIKVRYGRDKAVSWATDILTISAKAASRLFDDVFGSRLLSFRAAWVSIFLSYASFHLFPQIASLLPFAKANLLGGHSGLWTGLSILGVVFMRPYVFNTKWLNRLWYLLLAFVLVSNLGYVILNVFLRMGTHSGVRFVTFLTFLLGISFAFDLLALGLTRWIVRRISVMTKLYEIVFFLFLNCVVAVSLIVGPVILMLKSFSSSGKPSLFSLAAFASVALNTADVLLCALIFFILAFFLVHRTLWPLLERPLYAAARYGLIQKKNLLWTAGIVLLIGPTEGKSIFVWVVGMLEKLKG